MKILDLKYDILLDREKGKVSSSFVDVEYRLWHNLEVSIMNKNRLLEDITPAEPPDQDYRKSESVL